MDRGESNRAFTFDAVFGGSASQAEVYEAVAAPLLADVLDGYDAAVLAYGQTGSGKTHSLMSMGGPTAAEPSAAGPPEGDAGLFPRLAADLFASIEADFRFAYAVDVSFMQVYNEQARA